MQSGDTGVSLNPGPTLNNDNDEQYTQSSQSSIHACNGNSFLEMLEYLSLQYLSYSYPPFLTNEKADLLSWL